MRNLALTGVRLALPAWIGAAVLFVVTAVAEVRAPQFDSTTKSALALLRFPAYYASGFGLVGAALLGSLIVLGDARLGRARRLALAGCTGLALLVLAADYALVYRPLREITADTASARPQRFETLHRATMWINTAQLGLCAAAAVLACRPEGVES